MTRVLAIKRLRKDIKNGYTIKLSRRNALDTIVASCNLLSCTVRTFRQSSCNHWPSCVKYPYCCHWLGMHFKNLCRSFLGVSVKLLENFRKRRFLLCGKIRTKWIMTPEEVRYNLESIETLLNYYCMSIHVYLLTTIFYMV